MVHGHQRQDRQRARAFAVERPTAQAAPGPAVTAAPVEVAQAQVASRSSRSTRRSSSTSARARRAQQARAAEHRADQPDDQVLHHASVTAYRATLISSRLVSRPSSRTAYEQRSTTCSSGGRLVCTGRNCGAGRVLQRRRGVARRAGRLVGGSRVATARPRACAHAQPREPGAGRAPAPRAPRPLRRAGPIRPVDHQRRRGARASSPGLDVQRAVGRSNRASGDPSAAAPARPAQLGHRREAAGPPPRAPRGR